MSETSTTRITTALGVVMIFSWGTTYYLLAILSAPIQIETGWSATQVALGLSIGLLTSGLVSRSVGRTIGARDGRIVLTSGMLLIATGLVALSLAHWLAMYWAAWIIIGTGMGAGLYDAAFSTLGKLFGVNAKSAITTLTLWGGFASTICWPILSVLVDMVGWRYACLAFAGLHIVLTAPLCAVVLPCGSPAEPSAETGRQDSKLSPLVLSRPFWCILVASITLAMLASFWSVHIIVILSASGYSGPASVGLAALIGPAQIGARVVEKLAGGRYHPIWTMIFATALVALGFLGLGLGIHAGAALVAYGAGNGLWSIARATIPLVVFGSSNYPHVMGSIAAPALIAAALAPSAGAFLMQALGTGSIASVMIIVAAIAVVAAMTLFFDLGSSGGTAEGTHLQI
ncbi:MFS transporter [Pelagibacterium flavum]|uniref:MFS transporter n=1 Tax=Pelagibacterium flavum TaxID=2984530 RepID=A0ABY6IPX6_9HYPH|nr:MFS transporter [Pelagibacterium sp. YIM 151497]UYQ72662.1 MFS transporter [Pelagibacterium sp. YIM 151497]|tara:strand:- start:189 stop:1391 length:1203 start_codon:yes stop_codon:yes gene_type:complete